MWQEREREWELTSGALLFHWCTITSRPLTHTHTRVSSVLSDQLVSDSVLCLWSSAQRISDVKCRKIPNTPCRTSREITRVCQQTDCSHTHTHTHTHSPPQCVPFKIDAHGEEEWVPPLWKSWSLCVCVCVFCPCWFWGCTACGKITA